MILQTYCAFFNTHVRPRWLRAENADRSYEIPRMIDTKISYDEDYDRALQSLSIWCSGLIPNMFSKRICDPRELDKLGDTIDIKELSNLVFTDMDSCIKLVEELVEDGFNEVQGAVRVLNEENFIMEFGRRALPYLKEKYAES